MTRPSTNWNNEQVMSFYEMPFITLINQASSVHLAHHLPDEMECCSLLSVKTGACPEDCAYCPQSGHYNTGIEKENLLPLSVVVANAREAKANGAKRYCMGAAWRNPPRKDFPKILAMIKAVREIGLETCVTLGMLDDDQALALKEAGLDFYNHNLDCSPEYYEKIISTRTYTDRLETLSRVRAHGINVCCGGIIGMGETRRDRAELLVQLANMPDPPKSVPINRLIPIRGTPLAETETIDNIEFIRTIAAARIMMPESMIRLSAGRETMSDEMQALCFCVGANSIWLGEKLLTANNTAPSRDEALLKKLGFRLRSQHE